MDSSHHLDLFKAQDLQRRSTPTSFLSLPYELRYQIYSLSVPQGFNVAYDHRISSISRPRFSFNIPENREIPSFRMSRGGVFNPALLRVCKQVSEECLDILYGSNQFSVHLAPAGQSLWKDVFSTQNLKRIRHLKVAALPSSGPMYVLRILPRPDHQFWAVMFHHLKSFVLEADVPVNTCLDWVTTSWDANERLVSDWESRVRSDLEVFGRLIGGFDDGEALQIDISVGTETLPLFRQYFPARYQPRVVDRVTCVCGRGCTDYY